MSTQILFNRSDIRLLAICCTFRRPDMLKEMLDTFYATKSPKTEIFIYLHDDDPKLSEYLPVVANQSYIIAEHRMLCKAVNYVAFELFPGIPYYQTIVDDHRYRTSGWDNTLIGALQKANDLGSASPKTISDENWKEWEHPSAEVYSWKFISKLGYVYPRDFDAFGADFYLKDISKALNGLVYVPEVHIEHLWWGGCGKPADDNISEGYADKKKQHGTDAYNKWVKTERSQVLARFK